MRHGTLSDEQTLALYEAGESALALCIHEGLTPSSLTGRIGRARKRRGFTIPRQREARVIDSVEEVERAMRNLARAVRALARETARLSAAA